MGRVYLSVEYPSIIRVLVRVIPTCIPGWCGGAIINSKHGTLPDMELLLIVSMARYLTWSYNMLQVLTQRPVVAAGGQYEGAWVLL